MGVNERARQLGGTRFSWQRAGSGQRPTQERCTSAREYFRCRHRQRDRAHPAQRSEHRDERLGRQPRFPATRVGPLQQTGRQPRLPARGFAPRARRSGRAHARCGRARTKTPGTCAGPTGGSSHVDYRNAPLPRHNRRPVSEVECRSGVGHLSQAIHPARRVGRGPVRPAGGARERLALGVIRVRGSVTARGRDGGLEGLRR